MCFESIKAKQTRELTKPVEAGICEKKCLAKSERRLESWHEKLTAAGDVIHDEDEQSDRSRTEAKRKDFDQDREQNTEPHLG